MDAPGASGRGRGPRLSPPHGSPPAPASERGLRGRPGVRLLVPADRLGGGGGRPLAGGARQPSAGRAALLRAPGLDPRDADLLREGGCHPLHGALSRPEGLHGRPLEADGRGGPRRLRAAIGTRGAPRCLPRAMGIRRSHDRLHRNRFAGPARAGRSGLRGDRGPSPRAAGGVLPGGLGVSLSRRASPRGRAGAPVLSTRIRKPGGPGTGFRRGGAGSSRGSALRRGAARSRAAAFAIAGDSPRSDRPGARGSGRVRDLPGDAPRRGPGVGAPGNAPSRRISARAEPAHPRSTAPASPPLRPQERPHPLRRPRRPTTLRRLRRRSWTRKPSRACATKSTWPRSRRTPRRASW